MSYPQPNSDQYGTGGGGFFRLNTTLTSDGDMYESAQGAHGLSLGPDSDISRVNIAYFDPQQPQRQSIVTIGPGRPFAGFIQAANDDGLYVPSSRPGRILIWPAENFNPQFLPASFDSGRCDFEVPVLDVIEYFSPAQLNAGRNDKSYYLQQIPWPTNGKDFYYVIPFYGRRYAHFYFSNATNKSITITGFGVRYMQNGFTGTGVAANEKQIFTSGAIASSGDYVHEVKASVDGMWDAIYFQCAVSAGPPNTGRTPFTVIVSDRES